MELFLGILWCLALRSSAQAEMNMEFASQLVLGHDDGNWQEATGTVALHEAGLLGTGQILGLGDTGVDTEACTFKDAEPVPFRSTSSSHRKIRGYFSAGGDQQDGPDGHGTHIAAAMLGQVRATPGTPAANLGLAPEARLVVVDVEQSSAPGAYNIPEASFETSYLDRFRLAGANIVCSPWSYAQNLGLQNRVDHYVWNHPEFLPIFPSGNVFAEAADKGPQSPCTAKNALCVGASYNSPRMYLEEPSFVHSALLVNGLEVEALPGLFGATAPQALNLCQAVLNDCLRFRAACPECAFAATGLRAVQDAEAWQATAADAAQPSDGCHALRPRSGGVCVVPRGGCNFVLKAKHCREAGAVGVVVVNFANEAMVVMTPDEGESYGLTIAVVLVSHSDGQLLSPGARLTFPVISSGVVPRASAPYSRYGSLPGGRSKPDLVLPGDGITSTAAGETCGFRQMSGTSQSCGLAAGAAALVREYLSTWADASQARLDTVWASSIKAAMVAAAELESPSISTLSEGFGLPRLTSLLPVPAQLGLVALQSLADGEGQSFCLRFRAGLAEGALAISLAWTDPPSADGQLVNNLDLAVSCDVSGWQSLGGDSGNNLEKVSLAGYGSLTSGLCVVQILAPQVAATSPQPFALVASGPFVLSQCLAQLRPLNCGPGTSERLADGWGCRCSPPFLGPQCQQQAAQLEEGKLWPGELRPWQWLFVQAAVSCAGTYRLTVRSSLGLEGLQSRLAWGHLHNALAEPSSALGVTFRTEEDAVAETLTVLVRVETAALHSARLVSLGLQWQGRNGQSSIAITWSPEPGTTCSAPDVAAANNFEQLVLIVCLVVCLVAAVVATIVLIKLLRGRQKVLPEAGDVEQPGQPQAQQWQCQS